MKWAIYIGPERKPSDRFQSHLCYGRTGYVIDDPSNPKATYDFRPSGDNVSHFIPKKHI